jgi:hypothetical protein
MTDRLNNEKLHEALKLLDKEIDKDIEQPPIKSH